MTSTLSRWYVARAVASDPGLSPEARRNLARQSFSAWCALSEAERRNARYVAGIEWAERHPDAAAEIMQSQPEETDNG